MAVKNARGGVGTREFALRNPSERMRPATKHATRSSLIART
jgi:hypothetical protein